jgi:hypothetical protein
MALGKPAQWHFNAAETITDNAEIEVDKLSALKCGESRGTILRALRRLGAADGHLASMGRSHRMTSQRAQLQSRIWNLSDRVHYKLGQCLRKR